MKTWLGIKKYSKKKWLNPGESSFTGSVASYHGPSPWDTKGEMPYTFLEISDCTNKVRIHPAESDVSLKAYIKKLRKLARAITKFADHLEGDTDIRI